MQDSCHLAHHPHPNAAGLTLAAASLYNMLGQAELVEPAEGPFAPPGAMRRRQPVLDKPTCQVINAKESAYYG
jgi:hypothetical protein